MEYSYSEQANRFSAGQKILCILLKPDVHKSMHKILPLVCILSHICLVHYLPTEVFNILIFTFIYIWVFQVSPFPPGSRPTFCMHLSSPQSLSVWSPDQHLARITTHEILSIVLLA